MVVERSFDGCEDRFIAFIGEWTAGIHHLDDNAPNDRGLLRLDDQTGHQCQADRCDVRECHVAGRFQRFPDKMGKCPGQHGGDHTFFGIRNNLDFFFLKPSWPIPGITWPSG